MEPLSDARILESWSKNAIPWTQAVREGQILSRERVTNQAIIDTVLSRDPASVLDMGCGEGWLCRALTARGVRALGVDAVGELVERARDAGGEFHHLSYEAIAAGALEATVDVVVCNFSLLGESSVEMLLAAIPARLEPGGVTIIQTLHPPVACGDSTYVTGWRPGSWTGFNEAFSDPAPWYFRTLEDWVALFSRCGLRLLEMREPLDPETGRPASVIFVAEPAALHPPVFPEKLKER